MIFSCAERLSDLHRDGSERLCDIFFCGKGLRKFYVRRGCIIFVCAERFVIYFFCVQRGCIIFFCAERLRNFVFLWRDCLIFLCGEVP